MGNEFLPYIPLYDWDGDGDIDADDAMVYLSRHLRVRVTDPQKKPLPGAKCRIIGDDGDVYVCDSKGVALIPIPDGAGSTVDLEWEPADAEKTDPANRFYWSNRYRVDVASRQDDDCAKRLTHLGFNGETLSQQVEAYQAYFGRAANGLLSEILKEMADWHDGGMYPGQVEDVSITICLLDENKKPMPQACCRRVRHDAYNPEDVLIADSRGMVNLPVKKGTETIEIVWGPAESGQAENETQFCFHQQLHLPLEGEESDTVLGKMLMNMGFDGSRTEQNYAYEKFFGKTTGSSIDIINSTMLQWFSGETGDGSDTAFV